MADAYKTAMAGEIDSAIEKAGRDPFKNLTEDHGSPTCGSHRALLNAISEDNRNKAFGQIVLLRLAKAQLEQPVEKNHATRPHMSRKEIVGWCAGAGAFVVGLIEGFKAFWSK